MSQEQSYEPSSGAFTKARSHLMLVLGIVVAAGTAMWLESLDPEACRPAGSEAQAPLAR